MAKQPVEEDGEGESTHHNVFDEKTTDKGSLSDDEEMEEWERWRHFSITLGGILKRSFMSENLLFYRHEALYDDVTEQERIGERKYEEEMEVSA